MGDYKSKGISSVWGTTSVKRDPQCGGLQASTEILGVGDYKRQERSSVWGTTSGKRDPRCGGLQA